MGAITNPHTTMANAIQHTNVYAYACKYTYTYIRHYHHLHLNYNNNYYLYKYFLSIYYSSSLQYLKLVVNTSFCSQVSSGVTIVSGSFNVYKNKGQKQHSLLHMLKIQTHRVNTSRHAFIKCAQSVMQVQYFTRIGLSRSLAATQAH